jgi:hypothetical protein
MALVDDRRESQGPLFPGLPNIAEGVPAPRRDAAAEGALWAVYPRLVDAFSRAQPGALGPQFLEALESLVPSSLLAYYHALDPTIVAWCRGE